MNILPLADIHGKFEIFDHIKKNFKKNKFDAITISGDIWEGYSTNGRYKILELQDWCRTPIIMCQGNHDRWDYRIFKHDKNIHLLVNESVTIDGVVFYGSPYTTKFCNWAWMESEDNLYNMWNSTMPDKIDVAVMHQPPHRYGDSCHQNTYGNNKDTHLGSTALLKLLDEREIKNCFVGHIHTGKRLTKHPSGTIIRNVSCLSETYEFLEFNPAPEIFKI